MASLASPCGRLGACLMTGWYGLVLQIRVNYEVSNDNAFFCCSSDLMLHLFDGLDGLDGDTLEYGVCSLSSGAILFQEKVV
jgi:hypothetical protein